MNFKRRQLNIITPVFNDWESLKALIQDLNEQGELLSYYKIKLIIMNDGSTDSFPVINRDFLGRIDESVVANLRYNMGHQKAISLGLKISAKDTTAEFHAVMDGDGEDRPSDLFRLVEGARKHSKVTVAERKKRKESNFFQLSYKLYKVFFKIVIGKSINFGNYCVIPAVHVDCIASSIDSWNHLAASLVKSPIDLLKIPLDRGDRYFGSSKLNFVGLALHGFSAISVFADIAFVRMIIFSLILASFSIGTMIIVVGIRVFTDHAIPGWATYSLGFSVSIFIQAIFIALVTLFLYLNSRSQGLLLAEMNTTLEPYIRDYIKLKEAI